MTPSKAFELQHKALGLLRNSQYWLEKNRSEALRYLEENGVLV